MDLLTEGFGGKEARVSTKEYQVPIVNKYKTTHYFPCYRRDIITSDNNLPDSESYNEMCKEFRITPNQVIRPKKIEFVILMRGQHLYPNPIKRIKGMKLATQ